MTTIVNRFAFIRSAVALLAGVAALSFVPRPAAAQEVCADLEGLAEEALDLYLDELDDEFGVDLNNPDLCTKLAENYIKACQKAAKDNVKCFQNQIKAIDKQNQTACKALFTGPSASECSEDSKNQAKDRSDQVTNDAEDAAVGCESLADDFFQVCMEGL